MLTLHGVLHLRSLCRALLESSMDKRLPCHSAFLCMDGLGMFILLQHIRSLQSLGTFFECNVRVSGRKALLCFLCSSLCFHAAAQKFSLSLTY